MSQKYSRNRIMIVKIGPLMKARILGQSSLVSPVLVNDDVTVASFTKYGLGFLNWSGLDGVIGLAPTILV